MGFYKELGDRLEKWLKEKIKVMDTKVESIAKYHKYLNTELDYCYLKIITEDSKIKLLKDYVIPFVCQNGNMETNQDNYSVILKAGRTYKISSDIYTDGNGFCVLNIFDITNDKIIGQIVKISATTDSQVSNNAIEIVYTPNNDCEIQIKVNNISESPTLPSNNLRNYFIVQEINRQITIDPVEHVNESHGIEDTPVGHIISHMGTVAPKHYLICDGTEYNIEDYPYLAQHIEDNFGSISYFGGDGETTFRVPDLRGEFLRGTGTGVRNTGSGANVGEHQDGTLNTCVAVDSNGNIYFTKQSSDETLVVKDVDKYIYDENKRIDVTAKGTTYTGNAGPYAIITRPTNTSVLYCIKYEPTYFMNTYNTNYMQPSMYSEEERIVGCWIDGKPLYEKTIKFLVNGNTVYSHNIQNVDYIFIKNFVLTESSRMFYTQNSIDAYVTTNQVALNVNSWNVSDEYAYTVLQYTKTTDEENSFTNDMLKDSYVELTYSDEEIANMVSDILGGEE